ALQRGESIDAVIAGNDTLAGAAVDALAERRLAGKVTVIGHDADLDGCQRVVEGTQEATVYKPIDKIAKKAAELVVQLYDGNLEEARDKIFDGRYTIPYYKIEPTLVLKENMVDTIIKDNFHTFEEVYLNVPQSERPVYRQ
ncbi:MAG: substrate-binding domain-containing protein, partial [Clostridiales bacterium]|nr:substrate-binding domain-containing protein [Clostridiales bacterium]